MCCAGICPLCKIPGGRKVADRIYDIGIVGGGPAGLTAALYARRAGRSVFLAEEALPGGQITASPAVENYPGVRSMDGIAYAACLSEQVRALGVEPTAVRVERVCDEGKHKLLLSADGGQRCRALILATGSRYRRLSLPGEEELTGHGLSYCATCDGAFFRDRRVAVCGGGNSALTEALFLSDLCAEVFLIHRRDRFRGEAYLLERLRARANVRILTDCRIVALDAARPLSGVTLEQGQDRRRSHLALDGLFIAIGRIPGTEAFRTLVQLDDGGYIAAGEDCWTSCAGVFAAGDCRSKPLRQLVTATGDGAVAATAACAYLDGVR